MTVTCVTPQLFDALDMPKDKTEKKEKKRKEADAEVEDGDVEMVAADEPKVLVNKSIYGPNC